MFLEYSELRPTNGCDRLASLGHPSKFQRVSRLGFFTATTSLNGGQPNFARCLAVSWAGTLYIQFQGFCPLTEFCQVQNSPSFQVLRSHILAVLLHGTRAVGVNQTLRRGTRNGITELSQTAPPIWQGGHHVGHRPTFLVIWTLPPPPPSSSYISSNSKEAIQ